MRGSVIFPVSAVAAAPKAATAKAPTAATPPPPPPVALRVTPAVLEWHDLAPGRGASAELQIEGGPGQIAIEDLRATLAVYRFETR